MACADHPKHHQGCQPQSGTPKDPFTLTKFFNKDFKLQSGLLKSLWRNFIAAEGALLAKKCRKRGHSKI